MGFGHRVYKNFDPRARIIKKACDDVFEVTGKNPLLHIATELEKIALEDEYFIKRKLYPNVDFYSGLIYEALGMPVEMFPVLFAIGRTSGWIAQWLEMIDDPEQKIARPRQIYTGAARRRLRADRAARLTGAGRCITAGLRARRAVRARASRHDGAASASALDSPASVRRAGPRSVASDPSPRGDRPRARRHSRGSARAPSTGAS